MRRIAIAGFQHETNRLGATKADLGAFEMADSWPPLLRGANVISGTQGSTLPLAGFVQAAQHTDGVDLHPIIWCAAEPSAPVTRRAYEQIAGEIIDGITQAGPLSGVYLDLHGAMVADHQPDGEGCLLARLRNQLGPELPIVISLDLHANVTPAMVEHADAITMYRTYPHLDMAEAGERAFAALQFLIGGGRLHKAFRHAPYLVPLHAQCTDVVPFDSLYAAVIASGQGSEGWAELAAGFPPSDIAEAGPCLLVYDTDADRAELRLEQLFEQLLAVEPAFDCALLSPAAAVDRAMAASDRTILADVQDNAGAGGTSDNIEILSALAMAGAKNAIVGMINDPEIAAAAHRTGAGGRFEGILGGKAVPGSQQLFGQFEVIAVSDGVFDFTGAMYRGCTANTGPSAWLRLIGHAPVDMVVSSIRCQALDQAVFTHLGVDLADYAILSLKSTVHFRADFRSLAQDCLPVATDSLARCDLARFPFRHLRADVRLGPGGPPHAIKY